jgi:hypothetical protein
VWTPPQLRVLTGHCARVAAVRAFWRGALIGAMLGIGVALAVATGG